MIYHARQHVCKKMDEVDLSAFNDGDLQTREQFYLITRDVVEGVNLISQKNQEDDEQLLLRITGNKCWPIRSFVGIYDLTRVDWNTSDVATDVKAQRAIA